MALMVRLLAWVQRARATVGPERFDRVASFVVRNRCRLTWLVVAFIVAAPTVLALALGAAHASVLGGGLLWIAVVSAGYVVLSWYVTRWKRRLVP